MEKNNIEKIREALEEVRDSNGYKDNIPEHYVNTSDWIISAGAFRKVLEALPLLDSIEKRMEELESIKVSYIKLFAGRTHLQKKLKQMEELVSGIDVDNPDAVDVLLDALNIQKENYKKRLEAADRLAKEIEPVVNGNIYQIGKIKASLLSYKEAGGE